MAFLKDRSVIPGETSCLPSTSTVVSRLRSEYVSPSVRIDRTIMTTTAHVHGLPKTRRHQASRGCTGSRPDMAPTLQAVCETPGTVTCWDVLSDHGLVHDGPREHHVVHVMWRPGWESNPRATD